MRFGNKENVVLSMSRYHELVKLSMAKIQWLKISRWKTNEVACSEFHRRSVVETSLEKA